MNAHIQYCESLTTVENAKSILRDYKIFMKKNYYLNYEWFTNKIKIILKGLNNFTIFAISGA